MAQTIAVAGWQPQPANFEVSTSYDNCGRVIAITKNITNHDLQFDITTNSQEPFARLFVNSCLWVARPYSTIPRAWLFSTGDQSLDDRIVTLLQNCSISCINIGPWHSSWNDSNIPKNYSIPAFRCSSSIESPDLYILMPSFNAFGAPISNDRRMDYTLQSRVHDDVKNKKSGLFISEWFHFLHSQANRQTFYNAATPSKSLYLLSPFEIPNATPSITNDDSLIIVDTDNMFFNRSKVDDTMSRSLPASFELELSSSIHSPYNAEYTNVFDVKPEAKIFWTADTVDDVVVIPTTSPPLPEPIELNEIHMKVADILVPDSCGPFNLRLVGEYQNYFSLEGTELFLTREPQKRIQLPVTVIAEDYFIPKRFDTISETYIANFDKCDANITLPLNYTTSAYSYRHCIYCPDMWGSNDSDNVPIIPFLDWSFDGEGSVEFPAVASLGGQHCDFNLLWMQLNIGGSLYVNIESDTNLPPSFCETRTSSDIGYFYIVQNSDPSSPIFPRQHDFNASELSGNPNITAYYYNQFNYTPWSKKLTSTVGPINILNPNELDIEGERVRGDAYLVLAFKKDCFRSDYTDTIKLISYFGQATTTPPPNVDINILARNLLPNSVLSGFGQSAQLNESISRTYNVQAGTFLQRDTFTISASNGLNIRNLILSHNNTDVVRSLSWVPQGLDSLNKTIYVDYVLNGVPNSDQSVTIEISGNTATTTTTTTTTCPPCQLTVEIDNNLNNVYLLYNGVAYRKENSNLQIDIDACLNVPTQVYIDFYTENGYVYYSPNKPTLTNVSGETINAQSFLSSQNNGLILFSWDSQTCPSSSVYRIDTNPVSPTTTTTTTSPPICDGEISILCEQTLQCFEDPNDINSCVANLSLSSQRLIAATCCNLEEDEILARVFDFFGQTYTSGQSKLEDIPTLVSLCSSTVSEAFGDCAAKDVEGNCNETILTKSLTFSYNGQNIIFCEDPGGNPLP